MSLCVCVFAQLRQEEARESLPYSLQTGFFNQSGARLVASKPRDPPGPDFYSDRFPGEHIPAFLGRLWGYMGSEDLNLDPQIYTAGALTH